MVIKKAWNRRDFIKAAGLGGITAALTPFIPVLSSEAAAQTSGLKRLLLISTGNGSIIWNWRNNGNGAPFQNGQALPQLQGPILSPLDPFRDNLLLLDGIDLGSIFSGNNGRKQGNVGHSGHSVIWTGFNGGGLNVGNGKQFPAGPSIDQIFNDANGGGRKTIQSTVWHQEVYDERRAGTYDSAGTPIFPSVDAQSVFDDIFRNGFNPGPTTDPSLATRRQGAVDLLRSEIARLRAELPGDDKYRLDRHVDGLNRLEQRLQSNSQPVAGCTATAADRPDITRANFSDSLLESTEQHTDLISHAFACDEVRTGYIVMGPEGGWNANGINFPGGVHGISHNTNQGANQTVRDNSVNNMTSLNNFWAARMASVLNKLEAAGVLDETLVVWGSSMSHGGMHSNRSVPFVVYQGNNGPMNAGRYHNFGNYNITPQSCVGGGSCDGGHGGETNNNLLISLLHALGMTQVDQVGDPNFCRPTGLDSTLF